MVAANKGDSRTDWGITQAGGTLDFAGNLLNVNMEEFRVKDLVLDPTVCSTTTPYRPTPKSVA